METIEIDKGLFFGKLQEEDIVSEFNCIHEEPNSFLKEDALGYERKNLATTYVIKDNSKNVLGFVSVSMGGIKSSDYAKLIPGVATKQCPCLLIAQLGVTESREGNRLGETLLLYALKLGDKLKNRLGCKVIKVDSYINVVGFYGKYGFNSLYNDFTGRKTTPMVHVLDEIG